MHQHDGLIAHAVAGELRKRLLAAFLTSGIKIAQPQRAVLAQAAARDGTPLPGTAGAAGNVGGSA
jgi:hypothetical protein